MPLPLYWQPQLVQATAGKNKKSNESTKEDNKMEVVALNKADFLKEVYNYEANPNDWKFEGSRPAIVDSMLPGAVHVR